MNIVDSTIDIVYKNTLKKKIVGLTYSYNLNEVSFEINLKDELIRRILINKLRTTVTIIDSDINARNIFFNPAQ